MNDELSSWSSWTSPLGPCLGWWIAEENKHIITCQGALEEYDSGRHELTTLTACANYWLNGNGPKDKRRSETFAEVAGRMMSIVLLKSKRSQQTRIAWMTRTVRILVSELCRSLSEKGKVTEGKGQGNKTEKNVEKDCEYFGKPSAIHVNHCNVFFDSNFKLGLISQITCWGHAPLILQPKSTLSPFKNPGTAPAWRERKNTHWHSKRATVKGPS